MHITFDSILVTSFLIGSDNPASLSLNLSTSALKLAGEYSKVLLQPIDSIHARAIIGRKRGQAGKPPGVT